MSSAMDRFEQQLVRASRTLHEEHAARAAGLGDARRGAADVAGVPRVARLRRMVRSRGWRTAAGVLVVGALVAAGSSVFGPSGNPREITEIQCGQRGSSAFVTGEPARDCALLWPSLYHRPAPPLVAWIAQTGGVVVVVPAGRPPTGGGWQRLPAGWRADAAVLGLHVQLEDIATGLEAHRCWSAPAARALVVSVLRADGLGSWGVRVHDDRAEGWHPNCLIIAPVVGGASHLVLLVETRVRVAGAPARLMNTPSGALEHARLTATETGVNDTLRAGHGCASVARAAALWRSRAAAAGIPSTRYVLFTQVGAPTASGCSRVLVNSPGGGGAADVYAADLP
jgi:hypothetical protein